MFWSLFLEQQADTENEKIKWNKFCTYSEKKVKDENKILDTIYSNSFSHGCKILLYEDDDNFYYSFVVKVIQNDKLNAA